jgi:hypothetical protein
MLVKNLFDPAVKQEIIHRINQLTPSSPPLWGKMNVAQMLAHLQMPMGVAIGAHTLKGNPFMKLVLPLFKKMLWDEKPYKKSLPTDKTFVMTGETKDFETEKGKLLGMVNRFTEANMVTEVHPVFGKMTKEQWSKATWKHFDHHLQQFGV